MTASNFNLRGIPPEVMAMLKSRAKEHSLSVNALILSFVEQGIGVRTPGKKVHYHDLDALAGTWSEKEHKAFLENTKHFEKVDKELWA